MNELPPAENKRHYPSLDGLRAIAVLMVFAQHYFVYPDAFRWGWTGVRIFFVLSGFLITGILYDTRDAPNRFRVFYARRALRIFPLFYAVILIGWLLWPIFRWVWHPVWILWPLYLGNFGRFLWFADFQQHTGVLDHLRSSITPNDPFFLYYGHFWSLCIEEQFYFVWPLIVFWVRDRKKLITLCLTFILLAPICRYCCTLYLPQPILDAAFLERFTPLQCDSLLLGALLALWLRGPHPNLTHLARYVFISLIALCIAVEAFNLIRHHALLTPSVQGPILTSIGYTLINLFSASLILLAIDSRTLISRFLANKRLMALGTISYGFYVFHDIPHIAYARLAFAFPGANSNIYGLLEGALAFVGTLLLASLSYRFLETPFLRLKSRFTTHLR